MILKLFEQLSSYKCKFCFSLLSANSENSVPIFQGEGVLPMDTSETPSTENTNQTPQGTSTEAASQTSSLARYMSYVIIEFQLC